MEWGKNVSPEGVNEVQRDGSVSPKSDIDSLLRSSGRIALASLPTGFSGLIPRLAAIFGGNRNLPRKTSPEGPACRIFAGSARAIGDPTAPIPATTTIKLNETVRPDTGI
jgi:hypothetical protein